jgi:hypothetical protein
MTDLSQEREEEQRDRIESRGDRIRRIIDRIDGIPEPSTGRGGETGGVVSPVVDPTLTARDCRCGSTGGTSS